MSKSKVIALIQNFISAYQYQESHCPILKLNLTIAYVKKYLDVENVKQKFDTLVYTFVEKHLIANALKRC